MKYLKLFENFKSEVDYDSILLRLKSKGWGDLPHIRFIEFEESDYWTETTDSDKYADEMASYMSDLADGSLDEYENYEESYSFEDFTHVDMEDVKELLEMGLTSEQISIELDFSLDKVKQIVDSIKKNSYMTDSDETFESLIIEGKNVPTDSSLWSQCKSWAKSKYDVWPSAYACGAAAKRYKSKGGKWRKKKNKKK
jgi:hypothetical protein